MAPSAGGHLLVSKSLRLLRLGFDKAARVIRDKIPAAAQPVESQYQPVYARVKTQPVNRLAAIRQNQSRWYTTKTQIEHTVRRFYSSTNGASKPLRSSYPPSRTGRAISQLTSRTPFASTLRPNLTGGALSRSAGGYNTGAGRVNGARYFSHTPAAPAEIIQNVSQAVRAFWLSGQKAHFNGLSPRTGEKRFRAVSSQQDKARQQLDMSNANTPGSFLDFKVSPTITAIGPLSKIPRSTTESSSCELADSNSVSMEMEAATVANTTLLTTLEIDFARALKDLAAIMNDLKHLSTLGALPITLVDATTLRVRFPGCDADTVEAICRELNIRRGMVGQDPYFEEYIGAEMALLFPFASSKSPSELDFDFDIAKPQQGRDGHYEQRPMKRSKRDRNAAHNNKDAVEWKHMLSPSNPLCSLEELTREQSYGSDHEIIDAEIVDNPWLSSPSGYSSLHASSENNNDDGDIAAMFFGQPHPVTARQSHPPSAGAVSDYEGLEGIYRFIGELDRAQTRT